MKVGILVHKHIEKSFDDFAKQSLLPNGFIQWARCPVDGY